MIELKNIDKKYGDKTVFENFNLSVAENEILAVLGESGSGKTTLLNIIANLTDFSVEIKGETKPLSFVFQKDRLVPNLTVLENIKLVCPNADVLTALEKANLKDSASAYPKSLSAGMSRRVAILRALLYQSPLLLMDEPFINLDLALKYKMMEYLIETLKEKPRTTVLVTHSVDEATFLGDRVIVLNNGKIIKELKKGEFTENELFEFMKNLKV